MTGNGVCQVVYEMIERKHELRPSDLQAVMERFIESQVLIPGQWKSMIPDRSQTSTKARLLRAMQSELEDCKETI